MSIESEVVGGETACSSDTTQPMSSSTNDEKDDKQNGNESNELKRKIEEMEKEVLKMKKILAESEKANSEGKRDPSEYGYVYILQADLRYICCDYWFSASGGVLEPSLTRDFSATANKIRVTDVPGDDDMEAIWKMYTYTPWPQDVPIPYTVRVPHSANDRKTSLYVSQVGRYLRAAAQHAFDPLRQPFKSSFRKHTCPLMATPLLGTGMGGNYRNTGEMALQLLPILYSLANELKIDVALVTNDKEVYALMQWARSKMCSNQVNSGHDTSLLLDTISGQRYLNSLHMQRIKELSQYAVKGQLSLFLGAGASMGSNVPDWKGLLEALAEDVGLTEDRLHEFQKADIYTKAAVLEAEIDRQNDAKSSGDNSSSTNNSNGSNGKKLCLGNFVARHLVHARYSIVHALLAALPVQEAITTNFDNLFEKAWRVKGKFAVLPHAPLRRSQHDNSSAPRWLLKLHGCVSMPEEIVLTKSHYIRYAERYAALGGIVQASLLTRHLLFVGFSFNDDNFQRIYDPVRKAKRLEKRLSQGDADMHYHNRKHPKQYSKKSSDEFKLGRDTAVGDSDDIDCCGTALLLDHSVLKEDMWKGDICMTAMGPPLNDESESDTQYLASLARKQEIFLDILTSKCAVSLQMEFLMNLKFEKALSPSELLLRDVVRQFEINLEGLPQEAQDNVAFEHILEMLKKLGSNSWLI